MEPSRIMMAFAYSSILANFLLLMGIEFAAAFAWPSTASSEQNIMTMPFDHEVATDSTYPRINGTMDVISGDNTTSFPLFEEFPDDVITEVINISYSDIITPVDDISSDSKDYQATSSILWTSLPESSSYLPASSAPHDVQGSTSWFVLILDGNCSLQGDDLDNLKDRLTSELVIRLQLNQRSLLVQDTSCSSLDQMRINVTISESCKNLSALLMTRLMQTENLSSSPLVRVKHHDYYVYKVMTADGFLINVEPDMIPVDMRHSDVELIIYIAVGSACAFFIFLIIGLLTFKYCNTTQKPGDFFDYRQDVQPVNHLQNMHLEDYTLTRIPRPKLGYIDYCRGMTQSGNSSNKRYSPLDDNIVGSSNGMVQPFDTSVVTLEDAFGESHGRDGVIVRPMDIHRYGRSITRFYRNGRGLKSPVVRSDNAMGSYQARSIENLHQDDHVILDRGLDNPVYQ